jgi:dTDP-4-amino-4,6-dideoxygalactose transaminase
MKIKYVDLVKSNLKFKKNYFKILDDICNRGELADPNGQEVLKFEKKFKKYIGSNYVVSVNNGTSALYLALKSLNLNYNDQVITVSHSYVATVNAILLNNLKPLFCDIKDDLTIDEEDLKKKITKNTKAIILVHIQGTPVNFDKIMPIIKKYKLRVIEDCAQAIGSKFRGKHVGNFGDIGCFSFHPLKNLAALGDAGMIVTKHKKIYDWLKKARINGHPNRDECDFPSHNMRMSNLQAGFLNFKLMHLENFILGKRRKLAKIYYEKLKNIVFISPEHDKAKNSFHTFIIQTNKRDELQKYLSSKKIETRIHYPKPIHLMNYYKKKFHIKLANTEKISKRILSLPIHENLNEKNIKFIISKIKEFFKYNLR